jgi:hypothetical protein
MLHKQFYTQNRIHKNCYTVPTGYAIERSSDPHWNYSSDLVYGTNNFGLNLTPIGYINSFGEFNNSLNTTLGVCLSAIEDVKYTRFILKYLIFSDDSNSFTTFSSTRPNSSYDNYGFTLRAVKEDYSPLPDGTVVLNDCVDGDGNYYDSVKIGTYLITTTNLKATCFQNGDPIYRATSSSSWSTRCNNSLPAFAWYNFGSDVYKNFGAYYNFGIFSQSPDYLVNENGYSILTDEWEDIFDYLINKKWCNEITTSNIGIYLKSEIQTIHPLITLTSTNTSFNFFEEGGEELRQVTFSGPNSAIIAITKMDTGDGTGWFQCNIENSTISPTTITVSCDNLLLIPSSRTGFLKISLYDTRGQLMKEILLRIFQRDRT